MPPAKEAPPEPKKRKPRQPKKEKVEPIFKIEVAPPEAPFILTFT